MFFVAEVVGEFFVQGCLDDVLGEGFEQGVAAEVEALFFGLGDEVLGELVFCCHGVIFSCWGWEGLHRFPDSPHPARDRACGPTRVHHRLNPHQR